VGRRAPAPARAPLTRERHLIILGRNLHRDSQARELIDRARAADAASVLVVDMGWPSDDRAYADIATFGGSRLAGQALLRLHGADSGGAA
jgi:beta-N-acetylhexosaminidase